MPAAMTTKGVIANRHQECVSVGEGFAVP